MEEEVRRSGAERRAESQPVEVDRRECTERRSAIREGDHIIESMKKIPIFHGLSIGQYRRMLRICSKKVVKCDEILCREGDRSDELYILLKGQMKVVLKGSIIVTYITSLGLIGEMGVFSGLPRSATVIASEASSLIRIGKRELFELFKQDCPLSNRVLMNVIDDLVTKLNEDNELIEELRMRRSKVL